MRSSSICRRRARLVLGVALAALAAASTTAPVDAIDPERLMEQYIHDRWESDRGFPGGSVHGITQSTDGYLWIAADKGLVRFDGLVFQLFQRPGSTTGQDQTVLAVAPNPSGGLWAQLRSAMLARFHDGRFEEPLPTVLNELGASVTAMAPTAGNAILLSVLDHGVIRYENGQAETVVSQRSMPSSFVIAMAQTADGDIWLGTRDSGLLRLHDGRLMPIVKGLPDQKINALVAGSGSELWIGTDDGVSRWNGMEVAQDGVPDALAHVGALAMIRDHDANLWIGTTSGQLLRVNRRGVASLDERDRGRRGAVRTVFEDRDGNVWIGTNRGIERLRDGVFTTFSVEQGLPAGTYGSVYVDGDRAWIAPVAGGVYSITGGQRIEAVTAAGLATDVVYSISGGGGDVWLARQRGGLTRLRTENGVLSAHTFTKAQGLAQDNVYAVHRARDGSVWAGTLSAGISRLKDGNFTTFTTEDGLASNTVAAIVEAHDGTIWVATPNGVNHQQGKGWRRLAANDGLPSNDVNTLFEDSAHDMWIGTAAGLALARGDRIVAGFQPPTRLYSSIVGIAEDSIGALWVATTERIVSVNRGRLAANTATDADLREFGASDGLLGVEGVKRHRSVATDETGRIWLSTSRGLSMTNPAVGGRAAPSLVAIETVSADGIAIDGAPLTIPPRRQRLAFSYTGLSLATPERVQFRYRLDGFDRDWSAPTATRQAVYTNLGPGEYRFRVLASDGAGQWNSEQAMLALTIAPAFWQTFWFQLSMLLLTSAVVWAAYRLRLLQVRHQLNVRFEERLAERTRIAQELHDTLLQGFLSASMQLHVAASRVPADSPAKAPLTKVLDLMGRVIEEGRNAVRGLRSPGAASDDLHRAFSGMSDELNVGGNIDYRVIVEGRDRPLQPFIRDEIYRIGREAVVNAFRHSAASRVELALEYGSGGLRVLVRDNGRGIDAKVLRSGADGHWGLAGMRERADRIGAAFRVMSSAESGTEVELSVPARVAFESEKKRDRTA